MKNPTLIILLLFFTLSVGAQSFNFSKCFKITSDKAPVEYRFDTTLIINLPSIIFYSNGSAYKYKIVSDPETCSTFTEIDALTCYEVIELASNEKYLIKLRKDGTKFSLSGANGNNLVFSN